MPELPEVEVIRRDLDREVAGKKIKAVEATGLRSIRRHKSKKAFISAVEGHTIKSVTRRGKYIVMRLDGDTALVAHLGMSGRLLRAKNAKVPSPKHLHVVFTFSDNSQLRFVDPRTFGEMFVTSYLEIEDEVTELAHLGVDPLDEAMSWETFGRLITSRHTKLKTLLMDQKFVAGIGNIYSDEILFAAGLRWDRTADSLSAEEIRRLSRAIIETLNEAVKYRGSSLADEQYVDLFGQPGGFQDRHQVYDREGKSCPRCYRTLVRARYSNRSTFFCEACQI
ncbi:MAG: DNA-(apurinic or apyrimidinic site) lyase [Actinomycetia bacterium]|jgi:formamidopyrimidine-DNA glycosylase|nr:DNA-(apurinic or apyrimidinic site) lyase [Actinomycetes bacterium]